MAIRPSCLIVKEYTKRKCPFKVKKTQPVYCKKHNIALKRDGDKKDLQTDRIITLVRGYLA